MSHRTPHGRPAPISAVERRRLVLEMRRVAMAAQQDPQAESALVEALRPVLRGEVIDRAHPDYDRARRVWNGLIDRHPAAIAGCADVKDVAQAIRVAREQRPVISIRGGGHQVAGSAVCDGGLVIDLSAMKAVQVDPTARTARVEAGATWSDVDRATQEFGLATTGGEVSATGVAGLTLGGGLGVMMRTFGLSCDNLRSIEIVTADGKIRTASTDEHADLFWAARGGGRGLGAVTSFEFDLHPLGPEVATALVLYPYEDAENVLRAWRDYARQAPDSVAPGIGLWSIPPLPDVPEEQHGAPVVIVAGVFIGAPEQSGSVLRPLGELGTPLADMSGTVPYVDSQSALDELFPYGGRYYWKSHFFDELTDEAIAAIVEHDARRPSPESVIFIRTMGGAIARVGDDDTAFAHRSASFNLSVDASWSDPGLDVAAMEWARSTWDALRPFSTGGVYINFAGFDNDAERHALLGRNQERLDSIRRAYDPYGLFEATAHRP
ncbi:MAG: FAD-binding oxidoreductase [Actinomycetota bacterium]